MGSLEYVAVSLELSLGGDYITWPAHDKKD